MSPHSFSKPSPMEAIAHKLTNDVEDLSEYIRSIGGVQPSLDGDSDDPIHTIPQDAPLEMQEARERIMDQCLKLLQLATGPSDYMINFQPGFHYTACLQWLCAFNIFTLVPAKGKMSYPNLAERAGCTETRLKSVVRMAMTTGLFLERNQQVSHSTTSALFATNEHYRNWAVYATNVTAPIAASLTQAHKRWPYETDKSHTAHNVAFNHDLSFFEYMSQEPVLHERFAGYMRAISTDHGTNVKHVVSGLDWGRSPNDLIVDVGGSTGHSSIALAEAYPNLRFIVQDLPEVIKEVPNILEGKDTGIASRIQHQAHSFFETQPVVGADVYLLRMILHDWNFENCVKILRALVPSLRANSSIVIMDCVLPEPGSVPRSRERLLRVRDLTMMGTFNSQERTIKDWEAIFQEADPRLQITMISQPFGSVMSLIKVELAQQVADKGE
ncbi:hypothetical protein PG994_008857 [Apiospora phragmitis]|uniref:O-methyltransferase domain-containing protein n=1 Tax=Apiospora phragmitis TaxID=2905665 RepID=A0ABR1UHM6_9PEZI